MNAMDDSETSKLTRLPLKGEEIFGMNGNRLFFGILLLLLLLLFLIFAGVYYCKYTFKAEIFPPSF